MSSKELRYALAVITGVLMEAIFVWKFQPYPAREHGHDLLPWYCQPILALLLGLLLSVGIDGKTRWVPLAMLAGIFAANICLIVVDCKADPTNHNLWPFEFVIIGITTSPAFLGAGISKLMERRKV